MLHVIDISRYQSNPLNITPFPINGIQDLHCVIIGVTFGCEGANPLWKAQLDEALDDPRNLGIGFYHIRNNTVHSPEEEAQFFWNELMSYSRVNDRAFCVFMDSEEHPAGTDQVAWVNGFNDWISTKHAYPLTYVGESDVNSLDWDVVAQKSSLWGSQYDYTTPEQGWDDNRQLLGNFNYPHNGQMVPWPVVAGHQYSSTTYFGNVGPFDVSLFFEDMDAWNKYAGAGVPNPPAPVPAPPAPEPAPAPTPDPAPVVNPTPSQQTYTIQSGDTLGGIAANFGTSVSAILGANSWITNPDYIQAGWTIVIPSGGGTPSGTVYYVVAGDTLSGIAARYGTDYQTLANYNGIADPDLIYPGQAIRIP